MKVDDVVLEAVLNKLINSDLGNKKLSSEEWTKEYSNLYFHYIHSLNPHGVGSFYRKQLEELRKEVMDRRLEVSKLHRVISSKSRKIDSLKAKLKQLTKD